MFKPSFLSLVLNNQQPFSLCISFHAISSITLISSLITLSSHYPLIRSPLNGISITWTLVSKFSQLIFSHSSKLVVHKTCLSSFILSSVPPPHKSINDGAESNHAERYSMSTDISRLV
ncbi:hypothetical protein FOYG_10918 [Fusarium oxysporum NRRL 32931]|uniref:Uncharacterized protein n=1 Tax=Fusarium oxysporum NRRL 32931 TaxID=660029 RepID=W9I004_FUSOX|nr:hypothetical protein FOYG_10918 [Fusarium oxysporum NRRL 32931]EWY86350.1 hypothetical protein FOYG_10918 [Fusarium oxysporum NRRL 32931]EWY86351.1 hypothetical protein FOYG_10918 [Fusarium oxysporum NRRL 32931]EWY86352.1 hypothetical protein FOYG_10918 [Fusarium oxysporum NRRL 32931]EWY86353.1 hypothetical protein FOYG_10918 [Fusarium oxysporum NRRL 32931]